MSELIELEIGDRVEFVKETLHTEMIGHRGTIVKTGVGKGSVGVKLEEGGTVYTDEENLSLIFETKTQK